MVSRCGAKNATRMSTAQITPNHHRMDDCGILDLRGHFSETRYLINVMPGHILSSLCFSNRLASE